jgi:subtilisin
MFYVYMLYMTKYIAQIDENNMELISNSVKSMNGNIMKQMKNCFVINVPDKSERKYIRGKGWRSNVKINMKEHIEKEFKKKGINVKKLEEDFQIHLKPDENPKDIESYARGGKPNKPNKPSETPVEHPPQQVPWGVTCVDSVNTIVKGENISVAVIDTGIDHRHQDLSSNVKGGYNAISSRKKYKHPFDSFDDDNGHGTHVAGTIAATNNNIGVVGVGSKIDLYGVKVLDSDGSGWISDIIEGVEWAISNNMKVINMSLGSSSYSSIFHDVIKMAKLNGIVVVAAAGNTGSNVYSYPAAFPEAISVSAIDQGKSFAYFSTYNDRVDLTAPGVRILSTLPDNSYAEFNGTSMASPHVAGVAALMISKNSSLTNQQVKDIMKNTAINIGLSSIQQGSGLVSAGNCLNAI